ncbi:hypothetical protein CFC21_108455 [Triticum aestivum]|nr:protein TIFY 11e-like [Aegilops tauschii subsp. strangulata]XP_044442738.1 protein TIFY 11e-like [Triticum aestivum]KAF7107874.1 hypothetical protein CFC21_108455 [Triticum aestivum]
MAASGSAQSRRFTTACGVLSRCIKAAEARPVATVVLPLMPGAEVPAQDDHAAGPAPASAQMTIFYGGQVLVLDEVPDDRAAELLRVAAAAGAARGDGDLPMARKASLQRFMEKRKGRVAARAVPYSRPDGDTASCDRVTLTL